MELMEGLHAIREMCKQAPATCIGCPLGTGCPFYTTPHKWGDSDTECIVAAAEEWKKKRKPKTMLEVLKERFPYAPMFDDDGIPKFCPWVYFGEGVPSLHGCNSNHIDICAECLECWNRPAPEMYQGKE